MLLACAFVLLVRARANLYTPCKITPIAPPNGYAKNASCLKAALTRALRLEAAVAQGSEAAGFLWDMSALFDSIELAELVEFAVDLEFPEWILHLSLLVHAGARAFKEGPCMSDFLHPCCV